MSAYCLNTPGALEVAYTTTAGALTGYDVAQAGSKLYFLITTTDAWVAQGIADTTFTADHTTNILAATTHKLKNGMAVQVSNSGGALPTGLSAATTYWARPIDPNTYYLYDTRAHAIAGGVTGRLTFSDNGTGTQTVKTVATKAAGSAFVPAKRRVLIDSAFGAKVSVVEDSADGVASLTPVMVSR